MSLYISQSYLYISNGDSQGCFNTTRVAVPFPNFPSAVEVVHLAFLCPSTQLQSSQNLSQFIAAEGGWNHCEVLRPVTTPNRNLNCLMAWRVCGLGRGKNPSTTSWIHDLLCLVFFSGGFDIDGTPQGCFFLVFFLHFHYIIYDILFVTSLLMMVNIIVMISWESAPQTQRMMICPLQVFTRLVQV